MRFSSLRTIFFQPKKRTLAIRFIQIGMAAWIILAVLALSYPCKAADLEADAWPEFDIWIKLDPAGKDRIYILNSYAHESSFLYEETALGVSWDRRFHKNWSFRMGARYIWKQVDPPDKNETRVVLDLKWFKELGAGFLLTDRNRLDLRFFDSDTSGSFRYRNRVQVERGIPIFSWKWTGFGSYEIYYDSRYNTLGQRHRFIGGVSIPVTKWFSVDLFPAYHIETKPKRESGGAFGIAFGFYF